MKVLTIAAAAVLLLLGGCWVLSLFSSDETRITHLFEDVVESFNDTTVRGCVAPLDNDFREATHGIGRDEIRAILRHLFLDSITAGKPYSYRAELPRERMLIQVDAEAMSAEVLLGVLLYRRDPESADPVWRARFDVKLLKTQGQWWVTHSGYESLVGDFPYP